MSQNSKDCIGTPYYLRYGESVCQCVAIGISDDGIHDETYECKKCRKCCADEPMMTERNSNYEDKGTCLECVLKSGTSIEEIAEIYNR